MFKKIIKGLLIFFAVLLIAIIALPFIFKDKIAQYAQTELDNALDAKIIIGDFDLSILKNYQNFPNITLSIEDLKVIGKGIRQKILWQI
ncbi:MAG: hypothetical protein IPK03_04290 [Bacteroidetes bacterium]|nr:hypothetical protein [Bacteroidota bacterium]